MSAIYGCGYNSCGCNLRLSEVWSGSLGVDLGPVWGPLGDLDDPGAPETTPKGGARNTPPFGGASGAPGAAQTPKMAHFRSCKNLEFPPKVLPRHGTSDDHGIGAVPSRNVDADV